MKIFKNSLLTLFGISMLATSCSCNKTETTEEKGFHLGTGVNVSHWLSQSESRGEARQNQISKKDFEAIAAMGFEHVRLPIDEEQMYDENMNRHEDAFALMKNAIDWTLENNMNIIVDLHIIRSHHFNEKESNTLFQEADKQQHLIDIWKDLQSFLKDYPTDRLAYELLNEAVAPTHEQLNELEARLIAAIRETEPNRYIIVGSNWQQSIQTLKYMRVPEGDKKLILSFHYYNPILLTHYQAPWTEVRDLKNKITYPGMLLQDTVLNPEVTEKDANKILHTFNGEWNKARMESDMKAAIQLADSLGLLLYCGEFGVYPRFIETETRLAWYNDIMSVFKENGIANAHWCYKGDFPIVDEVSLEPNELPEILVGKKGCTK